MARKIQNFQEYSDKTQMGADLFNHKKYDEALAIFLELSEYNKNNFKVFETLALIYIKLNKIELAEDAYKTARKIYAGQNNDDFDQLTFDEVVAKLEPIENLMALYENEYEGDVEKQTNGLPILVGMQYMAQGEYKKAEEFLIKHKEKFFSESSG